MLKRVLLVLALIAGVVGLAPLAAQARVPVGHLTSARQDSSTHAIALRGWAFDPDTPGRSIKLLVWADGHYAGQITANKSSVAFDRARHLTGRHAYISTVRYPRSVRRVTLTQSGTGHAVARGAVTRVKHATPAAPARIIAVAKRYVGKARYREGGASPSRGFDCSGYTEYVFAVAHVASLPHNAEAQRHVRHMRRISRSTARAGDLVFYLSGGSAYHVAIYAGHGMQYAAATPRDGIRYQAVWSNQVEYRTITH